MIKERVQNNVLILNNPRTLVGGSNSGNDHGVLTPALLIDWVKTRLVTAHLLPPTKVRGLFKSPTCFSLALKIYIAALTLFLSSTILPAQSAHKSLRDGDEEYDLEHYKEAEKHYRDAADFKYGDPTAAYNLGNSFYQQGNWDDAAKRFEQALRSAPNSTFKADALHNLGNAFLKQEKYKEAVQAYEKSLRLRPGDAETKQNLQMAKKKFKEEQPRQQQEKNDREKQQKNQEEQEQKQSQSEQNQQNEQQQNQEPQQQNQGEGQPLQPTLNQQQAQKQAEKMKKEEARRLLETAIGPEDQKNTRKYRELRQQPKPSGKEKDW
jgi:tetratricopeptide (TPR) repeat protein